MYYIYSCTQHSRHINLRDLIQKCSTGDRVSQSQLYDLYAPKMFMLCLRYSRTREEAEETLQEGFIKVFEFLHQFKYMGSFEGWVRKIMLNCALQKYRGHAHLHSVLSMDQVPEERLAYEEILPAIDEKELLFLVQQLPTAYRLIFNLYVFEGLKHREIAVLLGISEGTSKSNLFDARALLKKWVLQTTKPANKKTAAYE